MLVSLLVYCVLLLLAGGAGIAASRGGTAARVPAATMSVLSAACLAVVLFVPLHGSAVSSFAIPWSLPYARFSVGLDSISMLFLVPLLILTAASSLYGVRYFGSHSAGPLHWLLYASLVSGMVMVLLSRNAVLFLISWEVMSLSSFLLVIHDSENPASRHAGWVYFVTAHIGTACLLTLFLILGSSAGSYEFADWSNLRLSGSLAGVLFLVTLGAFGLKAGFIPFHIWLPLAHPAAPSHVSALMSGIMIKMGIYGLLRTMTFLGAYQSWWGLLLIGLGAISGVLGVLFAIGQHDLKRLLAYSSVENIGIILLGIGIGIVGVVHGSNTVAVLGFCGGLLHVVNHALFKSLLFLGAGALMRQTGSGAIEGHGGLLKRMPRTGALFLVGVISICGLPFFNGFISELLIYAAAITSAVQGAATLLPMAGMGVMIALALIGGLAIACFTKVFGIVFLGEPRTTGREPPKEAPLAMAAGMAVLALCCWAVGACAFVVLPLVARPVSVLIGHSVNTGQYPVLAMLGWVGAALGLLGVVVAGGYAATRAFRKSARLEVRAPTWDCGYAAPGPSMQYTASSFASPILRHFAALLAMREEVRTGADRFPRPVWGIHADVNDWFLSRIAEPLTRFVNSALGLLRWFQNGKTGLYVAYLAMAIAVLIAWKFFL
jgi:hydrogenase-4 component B